MRRPRGRQLDDPVVDERATVVQTQDERLAAGEIGDAHQARKRQSLVGAGDGVLVIGLAAGGADARATCRIDHCNAGLVVTIIDCRLVPDSVELVGLADDVMGFALRLSGAMPHGQRDSRAENCQTLRPLHYVRLSRRGRECESSRRLMAAAVCTI